MFKNVVCVPVHVYGSAIVMKQVNNLFHSPPKEKDKAGRCEGKKKREKKVWFTIYGNSCGNKIKCFTSEE